MKATTNHFAARLLSGAVGGVTGAFALQGLRMASQRILPESMPPMTDNPDEYLVMAAERRLPRKIGYAIPQFVDLIAARSLAIGYGLIGGTLCSLFGARKVPLVARGAGLGILSWAVGYLGWLPRAGLMPPIRKQSPAQIAGPIARHVAFGIVTVAVSQWLARRQGCE